MPDIYERLLATYTEDNLNKITRKLIQAYRAKDSGFFDNLLRKLRVFNDFKDVSQSKAFQRLILIYHPDKINYYKDEIQESYTKNAQTKLEQFEHIFITLNNLEFVSLSQEVDFSIYDEEYPGFGVDIDLDEFDSVVDEYELEQDFDENSWQNDFMSVVHRAEKSDISAYQLQELTGFMDYSGFRMDDLKGIEQCINITGLDLSKNEIIDITRIGFLKNLMELNLAENDIYAVDALAGLNKLETLDLSFNRINDIDLLFELKNLKFVNLIGNQVPKIQIDKLSNSGKIVII